jgi:8-oxo-dGTP diphosphatase
MSIAPESPNVWVDCACGERHWGRYGAAGLLLVHRTTADAQSTGSTESAEVLLQLRAGWTHHGGTWALPGGARGAEESAEQAALREAFEEAGLRPDGVQVRELVVDDHGTWSYTYVLAEIATRPELTPADEETEDLAWVPVEDVAGYPLHPHFATEWPALRQRVAGMVTRS